MEVAHLKRVADLLKKYENKNVKDVIPVQDFPVLLKFGQNKQYVRDVIKRGVFFTSDRENYVDSRKVSPDSDFVKHNDKVNGRIADVASHAVINKSIETFGTDYRYQECAHPIPELNDRKKDDTTVGRLSNFSTAPTDNAKRRPSVFSAQQ